MIKMSQKEVDKLFVGMAHDLYSKFLENAEIIFKKLDVSKQLGRKEIFETKNAIENRLMIEFSVVYDDQSLRGTKDGSKKDSEKKKATSPAKGKVVSKRKRRASVDKAS